MTPPTPAEIWKLAISAAIEVVADQPIERARPVSPLAPIIHRLEQLRDRGPELPGGGAPVAPIRVLRGEEFAALSSEVTHLDEDVAHDAERWRAIVMEANVAKGEDGETLLFALLYDDSDKQVPGLTPNEQLAIDGEAHEEDPGLFGASLAGVDRVNRIVDAWMAKAGGA